MIAKVLMKLIIAFAICTAIAYSGLFFYEKEKNSTRIRDLQVQADSLEQANTALKTKIDRHYSQIEKIEKEIENKNNIISKLQSDVEKNINAIDSTKYDDLVRFFTNRYNQHIFADNDSTFNH